MCVLLLVSKDNSRIRFTVIVIFKNILTVKDLNNPIFHSALKREVTK